MKRLKNEWNEAFGGTKGREILGFRGSKEGERGPGKTRKL